MFKDKSICSNGRYKVITDSIFEELLQTYENSTDELKAFLREKVLIKASDEFLNQSNKEKLTLIKITRPNKPLVLYLESELSRIYDLKLAEASERDKELMVIYEELLNYLDGGENYEWLVWNIVYKTTTFIYRKPIDYTKFNVYKSLYDRFNLSELLDEKTALNFKEASIT